MSIRKCKNGHYYDDSRYSKCPHCSAYSLDTFERFVEKRLKSYEPIDGEWKFDSLLGRGSYGAVYKIINTKNNEEAALKVIIVENNSSKSESESILDTTIELCINENEDRIRRIKNEIEYLYKISACKYFVHIYKNYEFYWDQGIDFMIQMELLTPVTDYFSQIKKTEKKLLLLGMDICKALIFLESKNIIHNDVNPNNMYHSNDGIYKLGDLGMTSSSADLAPGGTIPYLSPETLFSGSISSQTDIYSLGASLYILSGGDKSDLINRTASTILVKPPIIGEQFFEVILEACEWDKSKRIKNASVLLEKLEHLGDDKINNVEVLKQHDINQNKIKNRLKKKKSLCYIDLLIGFYLPVYWHLFL